MNTFKVSDLLKMATDLHNDGFELVEIRMFDFEDEETGKSGTCLSVDGVVDEFETVGYEAIDSISLQ